MDEEATEQPDPVEVPIGELSPETLRAVIEHFVLREGTDYGVREVSFETKLDQVRRQLERGEARIVFDPATESVTLLTRDDAANVRRTRDR